MKGLNTLIRLRQRDLDELRRQLVEQEQILEALQNESKRLAEELERERQLAAEMPEMAGFYGKFAKGIEEKQEEIRKRSRDVNQILRKIRDTIAEAYTELKRLDIARDNILAEQEQEAKKQEQVMLDEVGIQQFTRKKQEKSGNET